MNPNFTKIKITINEQIFWASLIKVEDDSFILNTHNLSMNKKRYAWYNITQ